MSERTASKRASGRKRGKKSAPDKDDPNARKVHPKLRMVGNGCDSVNYIRAELSAGVVSTYVPDIPATAAADCAALRAPGNEHLFQGKERASPLTTLEERGLAEHALVGAFVELHRDRNVGRASETAHEVDGLAEEIRAMVEAVPGAGALATCVLTKRNFIAATLPVAALRTLSEDPRVAFIHPAEAISLDIAKPPRVPPKIDAPPKRRIARAAEAGGAGAIVGIIDVGGFDFSHPDFLDARGETRFRCIWDQGGKVRPPPSRSRAGDRAFERMDMGSEITRTHMNAAIRDGSLPGSRLEPQSAMKPGSHGTHVASIAAGNRGLAPDAEIAAVLLDLPLPDPDRQEEMLKDRRTTFADATRIVLAVEYLLEVAHEADKPISINISLGTNGGPHDGAGGVSRWLDALLASEGRAICVAAGNAGQEKGETEDDLGWMMGRVHASGCIPSRGLEARLEWTVKGNDFVDVSENELEIWYGPQDRFTLAVESPSGVRIAVAPREYVENLRLPSGTRVSLYNELYNPVNGANYCSVYLSPDMDPQAPKGVEAGDWIVRLIGDEIRDGRFHAWIERDDAFEFLPVGTRRVARLPSYFSLQSNVDSHSISSLACGHRVIAVANLDEGKGRINMSSSQGPTRDDRSKPDIAAPGTGIVAANGFSYGTNRPWIPMTGTSMASPWVAGVIAAMLSINRSLTAAQCSGILQRTSRPLPGGSYAWANDSGFGRLDAAAALAEAKAANGRSDITDCWR